MFKTSEYTRDHAMGLVAEARARVRSRGEISDAQLAARVRSAMGRAISHPHAIRVLANNGSITLKGSVLGYELDDLLTTISRVRGVKRIENLLEVHRQADIPELQGIGRRSMRNAQEFWSPTRRMAAGVFGGMLVLRGLMRRGIFGDLAGLIGLGLLGRSITNLPTRRLLGIGAGRRAIDVQKTITIHSPIDRVFDFFAHPENFPHFMANVLDVRENQSGRSHWVVAGPAGMKVEWDAECTQCEPNRVVAWKSVEGSTVQNAGIIHFDEVLGGTRVDIKMSYNPPGGALGHFIAKLMGTDPKSEMDEDLARVKTLIETGRAAHDAAQPMDRDFAAVVEEEEEFSETDELI